jgi:hypothetical protein
LSPLRGVRILDRVRQKALAFWTSGAPVTMTPTG